MNDRPHRDELLQAVERFLDEEAVRALDGSLKYQARVAANVLRIVRREIALEPAQLEGEWRRLAALLEPGAEWRGDLDLARTDVAAWTEELCRRIRDGDADEGDFRCEVVAHLRRTVSDKLEVAKGPRP